MVTINDLRNYLYKYDLYNFFSSSKAFLKIFISFYTRKWPFSLIEYFKVKFIQNNINEVLIVYDLKCCPPTYGDYLMVVMYARYFLTLDCKVDFVILTEEFRSDWRPLDKAEKMDFVRDLILIAESLLNKSNARVLTLSHENLLNRIDQSNNYNSYIAFKNRIKSRKAYYNLIIHLLSLLNYKSTPVFLNKYLLNNKSLENIKNDSIPSFDYISWHVRMSKKWDLYRNLSESKFIKIHEKLTELYPNHKIMLISDSFGCDFFKKISNEHGFNNIFYSKDYSSSFLGDANLILNSAYHFMLTGGGISLFAMFSNIPYEFIYVHAEVCWKHSKIVSWSNPLQIMRPIYNYRTKKFLPLLKLY